MFRSSPAVLDDVSALDIAFVLDTTGSMTPLLQAAREHMTQLLSPLAGESSLRVGFIQYRDHPPQDKLLTRTVPFSSDLKSAQKTIASFSAHGGGDGPEAVFDGVVAATQMQWRRHARRIAVLIGDAPLMVWAHAATVFQAAVRAAKLPIRCRPVAKKPV